MQTGVNVLGKVQVSAKRGLARMGRKNHIVIQDNFFVFINKILCSNTDFFILAASAVEFYQAVHDLSNHADNMM